MKEILRFALILIPTIAIAHLYSYLFDIDTGNVYAFFIGGFAALIVYLWDGMMKND